MNCNGIIMIVVVACVLICGVLIVGITIGQKVTECHIKQTQTPQLKAFVQLRKYKDINMDPLEAETVEVPCLRSGYHEKFYRFEGDNGEVYTLTVNTIVE